MFHEHGNALYLSDVTINNETITEGYVENGNWWYRLNTKTGFSEACHADWNFRHSYSAGDVVNSWPYKKPEKVVYVPPEFAYGSDYNKVINWARNQEPFEGSLQDLHDIDYIADINHKSRLKQMNALDDDDIPF